MTRLCINCRHCQPPSPRMQGGAHLCVRPIGAVHSRVTGSSSIALFKRCENERQGKMTIFGRTKCGPDGVFFKEPHPPQPPRRCK